MGQFQIDVAEWFNVSQSVISRLKRRFGKTDSPTEQLTGHGHHITRSRLRESGSSTEQHPGRGRNPGSILNIKGSKSLFSYST